MTLNTGQRPWRLSARTRKVVIVIHIVTIGAWIGLDVAMGVIIFTAIFSHSDQTKALCYQALDLFVVVPLLAAGPVCLVTGLILGWGSKYGVLRYKWVATKLVLNLVLTALVVISLAPGISEAARTGRALAAGEDVSIAAQDLVFPPIVSPTALVIAATLSVFKPWGLMRRPRRRTRAGLEAARAVHASTRIASPASPESSSSR